MVLKEKEIHNKLTEESFEKINNLAKKVDTNKLVFRYNGKTADADFSGFDNALSLINKIKDGKISLNDAKNDQARLISNLGKIKKKVKKKTFIKRE